MNEIDLPDAHFGPPGSPPADWRTYEEPDPDDEEMEETPQSVIFALGFDPKELDEPEPQPSGDAEFKESEHKRDNSGKFSSTGGGGGAAPKYKVSGPKVTALPSLAKQIHEATGKIPTPAQFHDEVTKAGIIMNPAQSAKYLKMYKPGAPVAKPPAAPAAAPTAKKEVTIEQQYATQKKVLEAAEKSQFKSDGTSGVYQFLVGKTDPGANIAYNTKTDEWSASMYGNNIAKGTGIESLKQHMGVKSDEPENLAASINAEVKKADPAGAAAAAAYNASTSAAKTPEEHKKDTKEVASIAGLSPVQMITNAAAGLGYPKEGTYNGIEYFKAASGHKLSYKPDTDTWQATGPNKEVLAKGEGMLPAMAWLQHNKQEVTAASGSPPFAHTATAAAAAPPSTSTAGAKSYGYKAIPESKQKYSSKGAATEKALPPKVQEAIAAYKGNSHYDAINDYMRFGEEANHETITPQRLMYIANLEKGFQQIAPTINDVTVGRKIGLTALKAWAKDAGINDLNDLKAGDMLTDPGIISTSYNTTMGWSGNVRCIIKVPKGTKAIDISETINKGENELMLAPRSRFKVTSVEKGKGGDAYHVNMELVNPKYE